MSNILSSSLLRQFLSFSFIFIGFDAAFGQICPAPNPTDANCYQTSRPSAGNPLTNWSPIPHQDCCNAIVLCKPVNDIDNGTVIPENAPAGTLFPGCVQNELPNDANTCFSNNEKGTTWYKFQIRPLPGGPTAPGSPAGKLRFRIIPGDVFDDPNYDPDTDDGETGIGATDYDFLLFKIPANAVNNGSACGSIKNSTSYGTSGSVIASCNWTGTRGPTGLFEPGTGTEAAQAPATRFNKPLSVKVGEVYYLAIDNFSVNTLGFSIDFRGLQFGGPDDSTAIVNPPPTDSLLMKVVRNVCPEKKIRIRFGGQIHCDSITPSKLVISGPNPPYTITSVVAENSCNNFSGTDSSFIVTFQPDSLYDSLSISVAGEIRDICGNQFLSTTIPFRLMNCTVGVLP
ncbi:MAG TPA: hypothetical protein PK509_06565, partial [Catalimonadaceae bacterium]|nr:hypothetical protein [Catalimonadaceae bacterium]